MTVNRPKPAIIAAHLERLAKIMRDNDEKPRVLANILAARGYPAAVLGSGSRSSDTTSSTERAVLDPEHWAGIDDQLARAERLLWSTANIVERWHSQIMACAPDDDPIPAGTGACALKQCEHFCNPRKNQHDRLKRGLCPRHYETWKRLGRPDLTWLADHLVRQDVA